MRLLIALFAAGAFVAAFAESGQRKEFTPMQKKWWAFQPVHVEPAPEAVGAKTEIDRFLFAKMAEKGVRPNPQADKVTLLRRASLVLTGLPPTPGETQAYLSDSSANAFEKVVDRLLASPHYGERWARHWLDLARYADSEGFKSDETRPNVWRYRDYVIRSLNADKPYDRFVKEQIAGDELYPNDIDAKVAVGFNRHFPDESNAANIRQRRQELLFDITDTTGSVFLGLTYGCAKCHDHKFDPILQKDYYRLQAFYANTRIEDEAVLMSGPELAAWKAQKAEWDGKTETIRAEMDQLLQVPRKARFAERLSRFPEEIQETITMDPAKRSPLQWHMFMKAKAQIEFTDEEMARALKGAPAKRYAELSKQLHTFDAIKPAELPMAQTLADMPTESPKTYVLKNGNYDAPGDEVAPGFLTILDPSDASLAGGRRTALANWIASPTNPLAARVMVNRVWHYHFGSGISGSPSDFGLMGERPTNLALLDSLTGSFISEGWSLKKLHKKIMMSAVWQQSSASNAANAEKDPENKLWWKYSRHRLEGEAVRDSMLLVSGRLNTKMYGTPVFPPLPAGVVTRGGWKSKEETSEADRRSVYVFVRRNTRYPMFEAFDMPDTHESCARRNMTINPAQSLELMNSKLVTDWSRSLAERVRNDGGQSVDGMLDRAWKLALQRTPGDKERADAREFLDRQTKLTGDEAQAWADLCQTLLSTNEFLYVN
ncbi:MAG: DUF1549 domain-containing protein [Acidobacteria bacterium]|nr:DUF1549 domain-containing protein [Acidobacteriota bacterium]